MKTNNCHCKLLHNFLLFLFTSKTPKCIQRIHFVVSQFTMCSGTTFFNRWKGINSWVGTVPSLRIKVGSLWVHRAQPVTMKCSAVLAVVCLTVACSQAQYLVSEILILVLIYGNDCFLSKQLIRGSLVNFICITIFVGISRNWNIMKRGER